ncbi:PEP-CTERM sorting domain-containing protein [Adhaeretor mobilis]|uniref:PEP-CTERM protein-sorting domain-containing protein n=1 Tax=Adhaeretor mobilis TaxID=1930276 RepID=A0A517MUR3_9BACT|nr:PEP-CTERM sorting domain-containing protein [Adhaeretor mobilis]QDS98609.1 hypothetical protein HG15A2_18900 [Adhaeretor mobilis]
MPFIRLLVPGLSLALLLAIAGMNVREAHGVIAPSTFASGLQVQGEDPGTEFDDWAGIPIAYTDNGGVADNPGGFPDLDTVQIANDDNNLYIRVTLLNTTSASLATMNLAFDLDNDLATGNDIFDLGAIGSELGYQTDFPFVQDITNFNTGVDGVVDFGGDFIGLGVTFPFFDESGPPTGTQMEWAIPRSLAIGPDAPGTPVFTGDTFTLMTYTDVGAGDILNNGTTFEFESLVYTFAENPNPGTPGDFNSDEVVDGADYLEWQQDFGNPYDADDLTDWQDHYGTGSIPSISAVPEASSIALAMVGLLTSALRRRR